MKLYQGLTQVQIGGQLADDAPGITIKTALDQPLNFAPAQLYQYLDAVLKPGSRHDENNLKYVTDPGFIGENFDFSQVDFTAHLTTFEARMAAARQIVADLNRHISVNLDPQTGTFELLFVD